MEQVKIFTFFKGLGFLGFGVSRSLPLLTGALESSGLAVTTVD